MDLKNEFLPSEALQLKDFQGIIPLINEIQSKVYLEIAFDNWYQVNHQGFASSPKAKFFDQIDSPRVKTGQERRW